VSGTISGTATVQDPNYPFRYTGDTATITFERCNNGMGEVLDGVISLTINTSDGFADFLNGQPYQLTQNFTYSATLAFADLTYANANGMWFGMEGNITLSVTKRVSPNQIEHSISGTGLAYIVGQGSSILGASLLTAPSGSPQYAENVVTEYDSSFYSELDDLSTVSGKLCSLAMRGCVEIVTVNPVRQDYLASHPRAGRFVITSGKAEIIFQILDVYNVDIGYDFDTTVDPTPLGTAHVTWTCLDANNCSF
jgi:hypothetical protein